nr:MULTISPECIES: enoyl-CoA hydratase-related protein [unclassified Sphingomonas]
MPTIPEAPGGEVKCELIDDHIALVTLNRPEKRNAVNVALATALDRVVKWTEADERIRVTILASSLPTIFCAGADVAEIAAGRAAELSTPDGGFAGLHAARRSKPWIAAVRGSALGGGCELCLSCDMIVAADDARFGLPEVKRGLFAAAAGAYRLAKLLPRNLATELITTGREFSAVFAHAHGMVNRLAPADEVIDTAISLAHEVAACAPLAVRESMKLVRLSAEKSEDALRAMSQEAARRIFASADAREGTAAFLEKRAPVWNGK